MHRLQAALILGIAGILLALWCAPLAERRPERAGGRVAGEPAASVTAVLQGALVPAVDLPAAPPPPDGPNPGELSPAADAGTGWRPRLPAKVANLIKRQHLEKVIEKYARQYGVDEDLVWAVMRQESGFNPQAVSPKGAMGLMQLMPGTAALMGVSDPFDVEQNIEGGIKYLEQCLNRFDQNVVLALAAYNAGPGNVAKYQGCPPFPETRHYVASILAAYAGESIRPELSLFKLPADLDAAASEPAGPAGLPWRIPLPRWKVVTPRCHLGSPQWKVTLRPF